MATLTLPTNDELYPNLTLDYSFGNTMNSIETNNSKLSFPALYTSDTLVTTGYNNLITGSLNFSSLTYTTGTASQSGTTVTGSGTTWSAQMVGGVIVWANGVRAFILAFITTTQLTVTPSQTVASGSYTLYYLGVQIYQNYFAASTGYFLSGTTAFCDTSDPSKQLLFGLSGAIASTKLTIATNQSTNQTLNFPSISTADNLILLENNNQSWTGQKTFTNFVEMTDQTDITKILKFNLSGNATGVTTTLNVSDSSYAIGNFIMPPGVVTDTFVLANLTQTLQNKTFLDGTHSGFINSADNTKTIEYSLSGQSASTTLSLVFLNNQTSTLTFPSVPNGDSIAVLSTTETFTGNNTFSSTNTFSGTTQSFTGTTNATSTSTGTVIVSGGVGIALNLNAANIFGNNQISDYYSASFYNNAVQSVSVNTNTLCVLNSTSYNPSSMATNFTAGNYYITIPVTGRWSVLASAYFASDGTNNFEQLTLSYTSGTPTPFSDTDFCVGYNRLVAVVLQPYAEYYLNSNLHLYLYGIVKGASGGIFGSNSGSQTYLSYDHKFLYV